MAPLQMGTFLPLKFRLVLSVSVCKRQVIKASQLSQLVPNVFFSNIEFHFFLFRYITVLYFLNDVEEGGETAFPVANNATFSTEVRLRSKMVKYQNKK